MLIRRCSLSTFIPVDLFTNYYGVLLICTAFKMLVAPVDCPWIRPNPEIKFTSTAKVPGKPSLPNTHHAHQSHKRLVTNYCKCTFLRRRAKGVKRRGSNWLLASSYNGLVPRESRSVASCRVCQRHKLDRSWIKLTISSVIPTSDGKDEKIVFPFRLKHLGKETYALFAPSAQ